MQTLASIFLVLTIFLLMFWCVLGAACTDEQCSIARRKIGRIALIFFVIEALLFMASALYATPLPVSSAREIPATRVQTHAEYVLQKVAEADRLCAEQKLSFINEEGEVTKEIRKKDKKGKLVIRQKVSRVHRLVARPVYLCAFKERDQSWHVVKVFVKYPVPKAYKEFPAWVATPGYEIEHVSGRGAARLTFTLTQNGERLNIYRYRHAWFTKDPLRTSLHEIIRSARALNYTPYQPEFGDTELRNIGASFFQHELDAAFLDLKRQGVMSRTYPAKRVSEVIHPKQPMILAAIEQTDDGRFIADPEEATNAIFIEYALNRGQAFNWSVSSANAVGALQFTNKNGNGTYDHVVRKYPEALLTPNFEDGTRDLRNVLKAAICLLDLELARLGEVRGLYMTNPKLGGIYPVAAYNEGGGGARQLYALIRKNNVDLEQQDVVEVPEKFFQRVKRIMTFKKKKSRVHVKSVVNRETYLYIRKYMFVWNYLDRLPPYLFKPA